MESWELLVIFVATLLGSYLSGIAGAGGGFIMMPVLIGLGLAPNQAVATEKVGGLMVTIGSLGGLRSSSSKATKRKVIFVMIMAFLMGLLAPIAIANLDPNVYRAALGIAILLMVPVVIYKKIGRSSFTPTKRQTALGASVVSFTLLLQGVFSSGLGMLVNLALMGFLGLNATEANITKRFAQLVLNTTVALGLLFTGLILWDVVAVMIPAALVGSYAGAKLAVKKGNEFIMSIVIGLMILSALFLLFGS